MPNINEIFGGTFLKVADLGNKVARVKIEHAEVSEFEDGNKVVLSFVGKSKRMVCNKTNCNIIAENLGSVEIDDWTGREIRLCTKKVEFQGKLVPAIRVLVDEKPVAKPIGATDAGAAAMGGAGEDNDEVPF